MRRKVGWTALLAVLIAVAFLPGVFAQQSAMQESAVIEAREQAGAVGGAAGVAGGIAGVLAALNGMIASCVPASVSAAITPALALFTSILAAIGALFMDAVGAILTAIYAPLSACGIDYCIGNVLGSLLAYIDIGSACLGICGATAYAVGSSCLLGTLSGLLGFYMLYGPCALFCSCIPIIPLLEGGFSAFLNLGAGLIGGTAAYCISGIMQGIAGLIFPTFWYGGHKTMYALGAGGCGGIAGAIAGAILGAGLGWINSCPLYIFCCGIPGCVNGGLLGAISGLIDGFGTGMIAGGWH